MCLHVLVGTGANRFEVSELRWRDIDLDDQKLILRRRTGVIEQNLSRTSPDLLAVLKRRFEDDAPSPDDYVVPNRGSAFSEHRSPRVIYAIVKDISSRAGVDNVDAKAFKPVFARSYRDRYPDDPAGLKAAMGIVSYGQLERYLHQPNNPRTPR
jgi:integrase